MSDISIKRAWLCIWSLAIISLVIFHVGFYNFDSHKYYNIALQMQQSHHYLVPYFQGHPYADKGPLIFWFFIAGWKLFGVNLWWPQLLMLLFATASILISVFIARLIWPEIPKISLLTPLVLIGLPNWFGLSSEIRVDVLLLFFTLLGIYALIHCAKGNKKYWWLFSLAIALGGMCKGPVILIFTLIPAIFFPVLKLQCKTHYNLVNWYGFLLLFTFIGVILALTWAIPAAVMGGHAYTDAIFFQQVSGRADILSSYFYYLWHLPYLLLPWAFYRPVYSGFGKQSQNQDFYGFKVCSLIIVISIIIFSCYGEKRIHYINPTFVLIALLMVAGIGSYIKEQHQVKPIHQWFVAAILFILAGTLLILPLFIHAISHRSQIQLDYLLDYKYWIIIGLALIAIFYLWFKPKSVLQQVFIIAIPFAVMTVAMMILNQTAALGR